MNNYIKYPRTMHLPWSPGKSDDDRTIESMDAFKGQRVIITEKMDGECTTMYQHHIHARSTSSKYHESRTWVKNFWSGFKNRIMPDFRICGENLYAKHSIHYKNLPSYFMGFSIWNDSGDGCLTWDATMFWFKELGITPVPVWYDGIYDEKIFKKIIKRVIAQESEGYVIRVADRIKREDFEKKVAKFVRKDHVTTNEHWLFNNKIEKNILTTKK